MTDTPTAEVVSTPKPEPFPEAWVVQVRYNNTTFDCYPFHGRERAECYVGGLAEGNHRLIRIPSEAEARRSERETRRQPLVDAVNRAAVELCEDDGFIFRKEKTYKCWGALRDKYEAAKSALAAFDKEQA